MTNQEKSDLRHNVNNLLCKLNLAAHVLEKRVLEDNENPLLVKKDTIDGIAEIKKITLQIADYVNSVKEE